MKNTIKLAGINTDKRRNELSAYGESLIGKAAQSTLLTMISNCGQKKLMEPAQRITGYEIVYCFGEPTLMVAIGGETVYEDTLVNIH